MDFISNQYTENKLGDLELKIVHKRIIYRHIAWLTALRHQLRSAAVWESLDHANVKEFKGKYDIEIREHIMSMDEELKPYLSDAERVYVMSKSNKATQLIALQSKDIRKVQELGLTDEFRQMELENILKDLYTFQGKAERIKNFPYPRQFATFNRFFIWIFILLIPLGMFKEFEKIGEVGIWLTVPFTVLVAWVFYTMDKIGQSTENPFEGGVNDVPITSISRTIEIDLREMLDEDEIPSKIGPKNFILT
jgi:putative membrane protein